MKLETKAALYTALMLVVLSMGSMTSAFYRVGPARAAIQPSAPVRQVMIPVDGVAPTKLSDTWGAARSEGRRHEGIDIMAPRGAPVHAAMAGTIAKLFVSNRGGRTIYQYDDSQRFILYYAHLDGYADNLKEGAHIAQGQIIGYVGQSGNATTPHLHFETQRVNDAHQWWKGEAFNPYLVLTSGHIG